MSKSRLEKFLYALYSLDSSDLPKPLSRIEELYNCLVTGEETPTFKPLSRVEKYLMAILGAYDVDSLPNPLSRVEVLLYKLATGDDNLDDIKSFLSEHEELLAEIIRNGGVGGNIDIEYVLHTLSTEFNTLYNTAEKPVKSAVLKGQTLLNVEDYAHSSSWAAVEDGDYPYFEGMQSVENPVVTTTGKNLFNSTFEKNTLDWGTGVESIDINVVRTVSYTRVKPNESYVITKQKISGGLFYYDKNKSYIKTTWVDPVETVIFTTTSDTHFIKMILNTTETEHNIQLEEGSVATEYEPYKSITVTCNDDVELCGVGDVKDELDLMTGEVTQRIGEVVFDGSEDWERSSHSVNSPLFYTSVNNLVHKEDYLNSVICDKLIVHANSDDLYYLSNSPNGISAYYDYYDTYPNENWFYIKYTDSEGSVEKFKQWLSQNPVTVRYELTMESVKTVDISVADQDGNNAELKTFDDITYVTLSSEGAIPEAELEVSTKNKEVLATMSLRMDDIYAAQTTLEETSDIQSENVDATMFATTEIYEELL